MTMINYNGRVVEAGGLRNLPPGDRKELLVWGIVTADPYIHSSWAIIRGGGTALLGPVTIKENVGGNNRVLSGLPWSKLLQPGFRENDMGERISSSVRQHPAYCPTDRAIVCPLNNTATLDVRTGWSGIGGCGMQFSRVIEVMKQSSQFFERWKAGEQRPTDLVFPVPNGQEVVFKLVTTFRQVTMIQDRNAAEFVFEGGNDFAISGQRHAST